METVRNGDEENGGGEKKNKESGQEMKGEKHGGSRGGRRTPVARKARPPESLATCLPHADIFNSNHRHNRHTR